MRVMISGAAGFIASHLLEHIFKTPETRTWRVVGLDRLDETSTLARIGPTDAYKANRERFRFIWHDLRAPINNYVAAEIGEIDLVLHLAASTHVDRSITDPMSFVLDNVVGTVNLLEFVRHRNPAAKFLVFSTDEVFGPALAGTAFKEWDRFKASNPYSGSKAASEELTYAYHNTYGLNTIITHCMNVVGERQHHEKYLPLVIKKILLGETIKIHADATKTIPTSRFYVHARNVAAATLHIVEHGLPGEKYNIGGQEEIDSLDLAQRVATIIDKPLHYELVDSVANRPGHDMRYALDTTRLTALGFQYPKTFAESLEKTVRWYVANPTWLGW